jgi:hypothetical protein
MNSDETNLQLAIHFLTTYPYNREALDGANATTYTSFDEIHFLPVLTWIQPDVSEAGASDASSLSSLILIICLDDDVPTKLNSHYTAAKHRVERLCLDPFWIYLDLAMAFSSWPDIWEIARSRLSQWATEFHLHLSSSTILE